MKLILENRSDLPMEVFLEKAISVLELGRVSNGQYCYLVSFTMDDEGNDREYHIVSDLNKKSDKLTLYEVPHPRFKVEGGRL